MFLRSPLLATGRAQKDHLWKIFVFSFPSSLQQARSKGKACEKGKLPGPTSLPHKLVPPLKIVVSRLEHWSLSRCLHDTTSHLSRGDLCSKLVGGGWCQGGKVLEKQLCEKLGIGPQGKGSQVIPAFKGLKQTLG